jgi:hypothetical protein
MVSLLITSETGSVIPAHNLSGDISENIPGGTNKRIVWNVAKNGIIIDEDVTVELIREMIKPEISEEKNLPGESTIKPAAKSISKINMLVSSLVLPGLGQAKARKNYAYLIMGAAGYACIAGAAIINHEAIISTYENYKDPRDIDERSNLYDKSVKLDNNS